jgi:hypothetical protein
MTFQVRYACSEFTVAFNLNSIVMFSYYSPVDMGMFCKSAFKLKYVSIEASHGLLVGDITYIHMPYSGTAECSLAGPRSNYQ